MKLLIVFVGIVLAVSALSDKEQWQQFKLTYNKVYKSVVEEKIRFAIFKDNLRIIETHNARYDKGEKSYFMDVNKFADLTNEEFKKYYLNYKTPVKSSGRPIFERAINASAVPDAIDWRDKGVVLDVEDQGKCGSCWAFSAAGALEGQNAIHHNKKIPLSKQELVDCSGDYGNEGCEGGLMDAAFQYVQNHNISTEDSYKYTGQNDDCKQGISSGIILKSYTDVKNSANSLRDAIGTVGPISVAIYADLLKFYKGGIFDDESCIGLTQDHGVLAIGYGHDGKDYWLVKNSWGADWGETGFFKLIRNRYNDCGIHRSASFPTIA